MSFSRPLYTNTQCLQGSIGPTGSYGPTGPTGPTGIPGPIGSPGGLNLYLNYTQSSGVPDYSLLSPLIDIDPNSVTYDVIPNNFSPVIQFLTPIIGNVQNIQNGPVTFYFYGSSSITTDCYVRVTGFITDDNGFNQTELFDISANITSVTDELIQIPGLITQGPFPVTPTTTRLGINLRFYNYSVSDSSMNVIFQTVNQYTFLPTTVAIEGPTGSIGPTGVTGPTGPIGDTLWSRVAPTGIYYNGGNIGIGTATPSTNLDVNGNARFASDISVNTISIGRGGGNIITNTAFGIYSLQNNTTGDYNTAVGYQSLEDNTTGSKNTAIGLESLQKNTSGNYNTAVGYLSLRFNTTGFSNSAIGYRSLETNTTGYNNTAIGINTLFSNTTGYNNTAIGHTSLFSNTDGSNNTAIGYQSLYNNTTGYENTAIGINTLFSNTIGAKNTAIGYRSLFSNTDGSNNTAIGQRSLQNNTGSNNVAIGNISGTNNTSGLNNTFIGANTNLNSSATQCSNSTAIGYNSRIDASNQIVLGTTTENVFIRGRYLNIGGTYNPNSGNALDVSGNGIFSGSVTAASFNPSSDYRIKENVETLDENYIVDELIPVTYKNIKTNKQDIGLIAHELQEVFPELVNGVKDGEELQTVNYMGLIPVLIKEIKELKQRVSILENEK